MTKLDDIIDITGTTPAAKATHEAVDFDVFGSSESVAVPPPANDQTVVLPKAPVPHHATHEIDLDLTDESSRGEPALNPAVFDEDMESADATRVVSSSGKPRTPPMARPQPATPPIPAARAADPSPLPAAPPTAKSRLGMIIGVLALLALAAAVWWLLR